MLLPGRGHAASVRLAKGLVVLSLGDPGGDVQQPEVDPDRVGEAVYRGRRGPCWPSHRVPWAAVPQWCGTEAATEWSPSSMVRPTRTEAFPRCWGSTSSWSPAQRAGWPPRSLACPTSTATPFSARRRRACCPSSICWLGRPQPSAGGSVRSCGAVVLSDWPFLSPPANLGGITAAQVQGVPDPDQLADQLQAWVFVEVGLKVSVSGSTCTPSSEPIRRWRSWWGRPGRR